MEKTYRSGHGAMEKISREEQELMWAKQREHDIKQSRGVSSPKTRIEGVTHVFDDGTLRKEILQDENARQREYDMRAGIRRKLHWA